jgi:hypothetical protein
MSALGCLRQLTLLATLPEGLGGVPRSRIRCEPPSEFTIESLQCPHGVLARHSHKLKVNAHSLNRADTMIVIVSTGVVLLCPVGQYPRRKMALETKPTCSRPST